MANAAEKKQRNHQTIKKYDNRIYTDDNTARNPATVSETTKKNTAKQTGQISTRARHNQEKATSMSPGFVLYLTIVCIAIICICVNYLQMKAELTQKMSRVASLESEYSQLKADNDAYYSLVSSSADIDKIKAIAMKRLGMKYASEDQIMTYKTKRSRSVQKYQDVPEAGR